MKVSVVGLGYVGLVTAVTLAKKGNEVTCYDIDAAKLDMVARGDSPISEKGLEEELKAVLAAGKLSIVRSLADAVNDSEVVFICVGTPSKPDGSIDLSGIISVAQELGETLRVSDEHRTVVVKSSVVPGTTDKRICPVLEESSGKKCGDGFGVCVNPEFLREGSALEDGLHPDRIVIGLMNSEEGVVMQGLYDSFDCPKVVVDTKTAEMIKYVSNALLATKISFANEIANICDKLGIDVDNVMGAVGLDSRLNPKFLRAGLGFGGSCFPKDVSALAAVGREVGYEPKLLDAVLKLNDWQPTRAIQILKEEVGTLSGKRITILGLAFKPGTDDMRGSRAIPIIASLLDEGAKVIGFDPLASDNARKLFPDIDYAASVSEALEGSDACIIQTDDVIFAELDIKEFKVLGSGLVIDGRRVLAHKRGELESLGIIYRGIGVPKRA